MKTEQKLINKKHGFTMVENCIIRNPKISRGARLLYAVLVSYAFGTDKCFPGQRRLASEMGLSVREVQNLLNELRGWGLITWNIHLNVREDAYGRNYLKTNTYTIEKVPGYIKREFEKEQKELLREIKSPELYGKQTSQENEKRRKELKELQIRMEIKGKNDVKNGKTEAKLRN